MDAYLRGEWPVISIALTRLEIEVLNKERNLKGKAYTFISGGRKHYSPLKISVCKKGWRVEDFPKHHRIARRYEIDIPQDGIKRLLEGKAIGLDYPTAHPFREVYIHPDNLFG